MVLIISFRQVFQVLYGGRMSHIYFTYCVQGSVLGPSLFILVQSTRAQSALEAFRCDCVLYINTLLHYMTLYATSMNVMEFH